jgi:hypothetical protein
VTAPTCRDRFFLAVEALCNFDDQAILHSVRVLTDTRRTVAPIEFEENSSVAFWLKARPT